MTYICSIRQRSEDRIDLTVYKNTRRYTRSLSAEQATQLAHRLMAFAASQQDRPFYLLQESPE